MKRLAEKSTPKDYYVYAWTWRNQIIYVGAGKGARVWHPLRKRTAHADTQPRRMNGMPRVHEIVQANPDLCHPHIVKQGLSKAQAIALESLTITKVAAGKYGPHALTNGYGLPVKKDSMRMLKLTCPKCGVIVRASRKVLDSGKVGCLPCGKLLTATP